MLHQGIVQRSCRVILESRCDEVFTPQIADNTEAVVLFVLYNDLVVEEWRFYELPFNDVYSHQDLERTETYFKDLKNTIALSFYSVYKIKYAFENVSQKEASNGVVSLNLRQKRCCTYHFKFMNLFIDCAFDAVSPSKGIVLFEQPYIIDDYLFNPSKPLTPMIHQQTSRPQSTSLSAMLTQYFTPPSGGNLF